MFSDKKNILILFLGLVILFFAYFSYEQNKVIGVLNQEIIKLANQRQKTVLEKYSIQRELDKIQGEQELDTVMLDSLQFSTEDMLKVER
tara:strand:- start:14 stop:280 length:267 start_codon:yes stop_codon:yes gene_type:complete